MDRIAWGLFGLIVLAAGALGAHLALRQGSEAGPARPAASAPDRGFAFSIYDAPRKMPDLAFVDGQGRNRTLAEFRGKVALLNIWATWCAPCREEMPALDRLQQKLSGPGFEVLALSIDSGGAAVVKRFYDEIGIRALAIYVDSANGATGSLGILGVPATLLIDAQGREIGRRLGPAQWDGPEAVGMIAGYVDAAAIPRR